MDDGGLQFHQQVQQWENSVNHFVQLAGINVNPHVEKKGNLSYLSWAWAIDQLLRNDPDATWEYGEPKAWGGATLMLFCTVTAFGKPRTAFLPVMDNRNKPIADPDAFQVNTAMQRCLVKAIALHGLGLYIYAGEDVPAEAEQPLPDLDPVMLAKLEGAESVEALQAAWNTIPEAKRRDYKSVKDAAKLRLTKPHLAEQA